MKTPFVNVALLLSLTGSLYAGAVAITPAQLGQQSVSITAFTHVFSGTGNGGGAFNEQIGPYNATIWCVDSQLTAASVGTAYTAYIEDLNGTPSAFDANHVRYDGITTIGATGWTYSFVTGSGNYTGTSGTGYLTALQNTNALIRYELAAILIAQYIPNDGAPTDSAQNNSIQDAIWELTANNGKNINQTINVNNPSGTQNWIDWAIGQLNAGTTYNANYFKQWAVVSGGWNSTSHDFSNTTAYQTFMVNVTPEPRFYGVLLVGLLCLAGLIYRSRVVE